MEGKLLFIQYVKVREAVLWEDNAKMHDIGGLIQSIEEYGFRDAPIYDGTLGAIVAGNGRALALREMEEGGYAVPDGIGVDGSGEWYMPVQFGVDAGSVEQAISFGIDHNNLTMTGGDFTPIEIARMWDAGKYGDMLEGLADLKKLPLTVDTETLEGVKHYLEGLIPLSERLARGETRAPAEIPKVEKIGEYDIPGVYCGDAGELMGGIPSGSIQLVVTSPPYDDLRDYEGYDFDYQNIVDELYRVMEEGGVVVWVTADATHKGTETGRALRQALYFKERGFLLHDTMIWLKGKDPWPTHRRYEQRWEYMFVFSKGPPRVYNPITYEKTGQVPLDLGERGGVGNVWYYPVAETTGQTLWHPAAFPLGLAEDHIRTWSNEGDVVLDPMAGSGTTLVMAHRLGRQWLGFDISETYVEMMRVRLLKEMADGEG